MPDLEIDLSKEELEEIKFLKKHKEEFLRKTCSTCGQTIPNRRQTSKEKEEERKEQNW